LRHNHSLGLQLVSDLVRQLRGTLEVEPGPGAAFAVRFFIRSQPPA
jgi:two-component sensor histidine kinase